ncbi:hypothetical protein RDWZM_003049 [Blomia tropicalis]|uniref:PRKR-interacting protein 1 n=1 Tax=Blomia tropicalis TaxID=40697 RepID=A0A9Q0MEX0_BLOTA|nr:PRKR-interacting protein 1 [Blomia tropicalis]KAJ6224504.1 hypothetical protein RDWZM_003049 [Blomia tropicalis]
MSHQGDDSNKSEENKSSRPFTAYDVQKVRLDKLFANIDKPVEIPQRNAEKKKPNTPDFVRNVMGSSAGAGSGEFHVYRHLRRKEFARLHAIESQARNEQLENEYRQKIENNRKQAELKTEKKRAKRQKKKEKLKLKKAKKDSDCKEDNKGKDDD